MGDIINVSARRFTGKKADHVNYVPYIDTSFEQIEIDVTGFTKSMNEIADKVIKNRLRVIIEFIDLALEKDFEEKHVSDLIVKMYQTMMITVDQANALFAEFEIDLEAD